MQGKSHPRTQKHAARPIYTSPQQLSFMGFETPFDQQLGTSNRWVKLAGLIPWDKIVPFYDRMFGKEGRPPISGRVVIGAMIIKHIESLTDRSTIQHIEENMYMQYFLGYSTFTREAPFTAPLFVAIRKRMTLELTSKISEVIAGLDLADAPEPEPDDTPDDSPTGTSASQEDQLTVSPSQPEHRGKLIMDATVAPQDITYPTDLKLLNEARIKSEQLIDKLYDVLIHKIPKPRTYRKLARKAYLLTAKKKRKTTKTIYKANGQQLRFLRCNLKHIELLLAHYDITPLKARELKYLRVLYTVYEQQEQMYRTRTKTIEHRIVNIHQPHVRPIPRGKEKAQTEFGSKLQVSLVDGFTFIDKLSWEAFNESTCLKASVLQYKRRFGYYPRQVFADSIYSTRENRRWLKSLGIQLLAKPLGRPKAQAVANHLRPADRNPIEGKFGQAKLAYGMDKIRAKLKETSESWIACIALVLNLVNLTSKALVTITLKIEKQTPILYSQNFQFIKAA